MLKSGKRTLKASRKNHELDTPSPAINSRSPMPELKIEFTKSELN
jgi:hypothetical protein